MMRHASMDEPVKACRNWFSLHFNKEAVARNPSSRWNRPAFEIVESSVTATGKRAIVVINKDSKKTIMAKVDLPNSGNLVVATPEQPDTQSTSGTLQISGAFRCHHHGVVKIVRSIARCSTVAVKKQ
jgi:hypothetical protein